MANRWRRKILRNSAIGALQRKSLLGKLFVYKEFATELRLVHCTESNNLALAKELRLVHCTESNNLPNIYVLCIAQKVTTWHVPSFLEALKDQDTLEKSSEESKEGLEGQQFVHPYRHHLKKLVNI